MLRTAIKKVGDKVYEYKYQAPDKGEEYLWIRLPPMGDENVGFTKGGWHRMPDDVFKSKEYPVCPKCKDKFVPIRDYKKCFKCRFTT